MPVARWPTGVITLSSGTGATAVGGASVVVATGVVAVGATVVGAAVVAVVRGGAGVATGAGSTPTPPSVLAEPLACGDAASTVAQAASRVSAAARRAGRRRGKRTLHRVIAAFATP